VKFKIADDKQIRISMIKNINNNIMIKYQIHSKCLNTTGTGNNYHAIIPEAAEWNIR
jgi:hypothetical protein